MARQESQSKLLYYPTPADVVALVASWLSVKSDAGLTRLADPCVGEGTALRQLADTLHAPKCETWGIELSYARAEKAKQMVDVVLPTSFYIATWTPKSVSLVFDNPPYDWSDTVDDKGRKIRHEVLFATKCTPKLVAGGVHVLIVPQRILADETLARHWAGWYTQTQLFRFPDGAFEAFGQVVLFGVCREKYQAATKAQIEAFQAQATAELSPLVPGDGRYALPTAPTFAKFAYIPMDDDALVLATSPVNMLAAPEWERVTYVRPVGAPINPLVQLKIGHLSMLISAGELGVVNLSRPEGQMLVKGTLTKQVCHTETPVINDKGEVTAINVEERERLESVITVLHGDGRRERFTGTQPVADFITENAAPLADAVLERNAPFYDWKPLRQEWDTAGKTALGLPPLPGRSERGLFDVQKHFAIASARRMAAAHHVVLNCEMGFGKTATAVGTLELRNRWPALVMCPGHMVEKWRRDLEAASDPKAPIVARIITRPARAEAAWLSERILPILAEYGAELLQDDRWQTAPTGENDTGRRRRLTIRVNVEQRRALIDRLTRLTTVKGTNGNVPLKPSLQTTTTGFTLEGLDRDDYTLADFFADYDPGHLGKKAVAVVAFEPAKYDAGLKPIDLSRRWFKVWDERDEAWIIVRAPCCPSCGQPIGLKRIEGRLVAVAPVIEMPNGRLEVRPTIPDVCEYEEAELALGPDGQPARLNGKPILVTRPCNTRLYELSRWRRVGLARLIQRKYPHRFQVYVADEVHEAKSGDTDIGTADGRFLSSIRDSLALTGTLFGGTASSLFYLLYRRNPDVRQLYGYKDVTRWVDHYGLWKFRWSEEPNGKTRGKSSGIQRWNVREPDELPGVSPAVIRFLLPMTLFGKITDLGYTLPPLSDRVEAVDMGEELGPHYRRLSDILLKKALERLQKDNDPGLITVWFSTCRYRPMSAYRDELVSYQGEPILPLPAVVDERMHLPKEEKLAELVQANLKRGRKTLVFVEQTGTRDIRERLAVSLRQSVPGANVQTLSSGDMKPAKREMWIRRNAPFMDVLLVNAGLVKTGLDLVMFSDVVFYETNTSLYTVWQAMRRVWRLGQKQNVTTTFLAYADAIESTLLALMGQKMKAAMLLYGDNAAGALVDNDGDDDLAREVIRQALEGKTIESAGAIAGQSLFGGETVQSVPVTESPMGSPVAISPVLPMLAPEPIVLAQVMQLDLFGNMVVTVPGKAGGRKRR